MPKIDYEKIKNDDDLMLPSVDYVFCRLFGSQNSKERLISLLNSILVGQPHIKDVIIDPTEYRKTTPDGKSIRLDVKATTDDGTIINVALCTKDIDTILKNSVAQGQAINEMQSAVQMQCINVKDVISRAEFTNAVILRDYTIAQGQEYHQIPDRIIIWITLQDVTSRQGCIHEAVLMYKYNGVDPVEIASEHLRIFVIELSKLEAMNGQHLDDMFKGWMSFIKHPKNLSDKYLDIPIMQDALAELAYLSHNKEARMEYNDRMLFLSDVHSGMAEHYNDGMEKGLKEGEEIGIKKGLEIGREEGAKQKAVETAKNLIKLNILTIEQIADASGLSAEDVNALRDEGEITI